MNPNFSNRSNNKKIFGPLPPAQLRPYLQIFSAE